MSLCGSEDGPEGPTVAKINILFYDEQAIVILSYLHRLLYVFMMLFKKTYKADFYLPWIYGLQRNP